MIQASTNKSERFNQFVQWVSFDGDSLIDGRCRTRLDGLVFPVADAYWV
jgi:hypothetical protein